MDFDFIMVNKRILDYAKYKQEILLQKNNLAAAIRELLEDLEFKLTSSSELNYHHEKLDFYNEEKDIEVLIVIRKTEKEIFV